MRIPTICMRLAFAVCIFAAASCMNVSKMRIEANEASALKTLDIFRNAFFAYENSYWTFPKEQSQLGPPQGGNPSSKYSADLVDLVLAPSGGAPASKDGYTFRYVAGPADKNGIIATYSIYADPLSYNSTGTKRFFMDDSYDIHYTTDNSKPSAASPILPR